MKNPLSLIVGAELDSVVFIRDYVQFSFQPASGPRCTLTAVADPVVRMASKETRRVDPGWRDALCTRIGCTVIRAEAIPTLEIALDFDDGMTMLIPLAAGDAIGAEAAILHRGDVASAVWRIGET